MLMPSLILVRFLLLLSGSALYSTCKLLALWALVFRCVYTELIHLYSQVYIILLSHKCAVWVFSTRRWANCACVGPYSGACSANPTRIFQVWHVFKDKEHMHLWGCTQGTTNSRSPKRFVWHQLKTKMSLFCKHMYFKFVVYVILVSEFYVFCRC